jgi:A118 family predicted phage portal protein
MLKLWAKVIEFLKKVFKITNFPQQVANADALVMRWWDIYSSKPDWLSYSYVTSNGHQCNKKRRTLGAAKIVCAELAGLVLAEVPAITAGKLVDAVIKQERFWANLRKYTEYQVALGGMVIKARPEGKRIVLDFVTAMNFLPLSSDNRAVQEASFIDRRVSGSKSFVRVETYRKTETGYNVTSRAFDEDTKYEVPLDELWPGVTASVDLAIDEVPFVYFANPEANNIDPESPMGISALHNAVDTFQALDIAYDEFIWEVESGQRRIALPGVCMRTYLDPESGQSRMGINLGDRVYVRLEGDDAEKFKPVDLTSDIRSEQFISAINFQLNILAIQTGFDAGYFSFDGVSMKTATEIISESSHTYKTREAYRGVTDEGLKRLFAIINKLGKIYKIEGATDVEPTILWDDGIIEDRNSRATYHEQLFAQGLEDRVTAIKAIHGLDDTKAAEMAARIKVDTAVVVDPFGLGK